MTDKEREDFLAHAEKVLTAVRDSFNAETYRCPCCKTDRYQNWHEQKCRDQLNGALSRINHVRERLKGNFPVRN